MLSLTLYLLITKTLTSYSLFLQLFLIEVGSETESTVDSEFARTQFEDLVPSPTSEKAFLAQIHARKPGYMHGGAAPSTMRSDVWVPPVQGYSLSTRTLSGAKENENMVVSFFILRRDDAASFSDRSGKGATFELALWLPPSQFPESISNRCWLRAWLPQGLCWFDTN